MSSSRAKVKNVVIRHDALSVELTDGRVISAPLTWYPTLLQASVKQLRDWKTCGASTGIHWPATTRKNSGTPSGPAWCEKSAQIDSSAHAGDIRQPARAGGRFFLIPRRRIRSNAIAFSY